MMCHIAICLHFEKSKMAAEIGEFLISMPFDSLTPILSLTPIWLFSSILTKNLTMSRVSRSVSIHNPAYHNPSFPKQVATAIYLFTCQAVLPAKKVSKNGLVFHD